MTLPNVTVKKLDGQTGSVPPGSTGILAIIATAASAALAVDTPQSFTRGDVALTALGNGPLLESGVYDMAVSGNPFLAVVPATSTAASYGSVTKTGTGTYTPTAGGTSPLDDYQVVINWIAGTSAIGVTGATYQYSLDGGNSFSATQALGTASTVTLNLPASAGGGSSGVSFALGSGTIVAGDSMTCNVTAPRMTSSDLAAALTALGNTRSPWEIVFIGVECTGGEIGQVDTWLQGLEGRGLFKAAIMYVRHKNLPVPSAETESAYLTAVTTIISGQSSIRLVVAADAGDVVSQVSGLKLPRSTALAVAARAMLIPLGEDPAFVGRGNVAGFAVSDNQGNPRWHDEDLFPGEDAIRLATLRTTPPGADAPGVYITNAPILSSPTSDYQFLQHARTMNRACEIAYAELFQQLSIGVNKQKPDPVTGAIYMAEADRQRIESLVQDAIDQSELKGQVAGITFTLAGDDDISSNSGAIVHGSVAIESLAYIKQFAVTAAFAKSV